MPPDLGPSGLTTHVRYHPLIKHDSATRGTSGYRRTVLGAGSVGSRSRRLAYVARHRHNRLAALGGYARIRAPSWNRRPWRVRVRASTGRRTPPGAKQRRGTHYVTSRPCRCAVLSYAGPGPSSQVNTSLSTSSALPSTQRSIIESPGTISGDIDFRQAKQSWLNPSM
jgi:hypothetical protein